MYDDIYIFWLIAFLSVILIILIDKFTKSKETLTVNLPNYREEIYLKDYYKKRYFFSRNENIVFKRLQIILHDISQPYKYIIFSKVRVSDVIGTKWNQEWTWKKINPRHFDFVLCDISNDFEPVVIIELDDDSHLASDVKRRDEMKNTICESIRLPLLRIYWYYSDEQIKQSLLEIL